MNDDITTWLDAYDATRVLSDYFYDEQIPGMTAKADTVIRYLRQLHETGYAGLASLQERETDAE